MDKTIRFKLILMMVLEFFIWGAWFPLIFGYLPSLGFSPSEQSWILNAFPIAAIVGMGALIVPSLELAPGDVIVSSVRSYQCPVSSSQ